MGPTGAVQSGSPTGRGRERAAQGDNPFIKYIFIFCILPPFSRLIAATPQRARVAKVESRVLRNINRQTALLNTRPVNLLTNNLLESSGQLFLRSGFESTHAPADELLMDR